MTHKIHHVFVSAESRDYVRYPYSNTYTLHITNPIKNISKVELLHASVPNTMYNITNGTNIVTISGTAFSIAPGFYNADNLAVELQNAIYNDTGVTVEYIEPEGKFFFSNSTSFTVTCTVEIARLLGLVNGTVYTSVTEALNNNIRDTGKYYVKSATLTNISINEGVFLDIEELRTTQNEDAMSITSDTYSGQNIRNTFGYIPMDVNPGNIKRFKKMSDYDFVVDYSYPIPKIDRLSIRWLDKQGRSLVFNGIDDNSFLLRFYCEK